MIVGKVDSSDSEGSMGNGSVGGNRRTHLFGPSQE